MALAAGIIAGAVISVGLDYGFARDIRVTRIYLRTRDAPASTGKPDLLMRCSSRMAASQREFWGNTPHLLQVTLGCCSAGFAAGFTGAYVADNRRARLLPVLAGAALSAGIYCTLLR